MILAVLLIGKIFKSQLSKRWHYYIWLVVVLRLLLPFSLDYGLGSIGSLEQAPTAPSYSVAPPTADGVFKQEASEFPSALEESADAISLGSLMNNLNTVMDTLWIPWLLVALALLIRKITLYQSFVKYISAGKTEMSDPAVLNIFGDVCTELKINRTIELYINSLVSSPLLIGIRSPYVVLPTMPAGEIEFRYICLHELTHYKRGDIYYKWLMQLILCLHWFNPLIHLMTKKASRACELSCDSAMMRGFSAMEREMYGDTLLESLKSPGEYREGIAALTLSENASRLGERLQEIKKSPKKKKWTSGLAILSVVLLFGGGVSLGVYSAKTPEPANRLSLADKIIYTDVGIDHTAHPAPLGKNIYIWDGSYPENFEAVDSETYTWDNAFAPTMMPKGYREDAVLGATITREVIYVNDNGAELIFSQDDDNVSGEISFDTENAQVAESVIINDSEGFLINKDGRNTLIWSIDDKLFYLYSNESSEALIAIAGGVKPSKYLHLPDAVPVQKQLVQEFTASVEYDKQDCVLRFTIPEEIPPECTFNVWLNGNLNAGDAGMSVKVFRSESEKVSWEPGKTYTHQFGKDSLRDMIILAEATLVENPDTSYADNVTIDANGEIIINSSESYSYK
jgi:beta-lactamase regulating signal transducer with metallopeptidase domain